MKTITFGIQKGGTGKTSISMSVACQLALEGNQVLFIDADPQGNASGWGLKDIRNELADIFLHGATLEDTIHRTSITNLYMIPTAGLNGELRLYGQTKAVEKLFAMRKLMPQIQDLGFDYVVIDTSPAFNALEKQCFLASDEVIPILQLDIFSTDGLGIFTNLVKSLKEDYDSDRPSIKRIVLNSQDNRLPQQKALMELYQKMNIELHVIPVDQAFKKSQGAGIFLQEYEGTKKETLDAVKHLAESINIRGLNYELGEKENHEQWDTTRAS